MGSSDSNDNNGEFYKTEYIDVAVSLNVCMGGGGQLGNQLPIYGKYM